MKIYKQNKFGFIESIETDGSYCPKGWSKTRYAAERKKLSSKQRDDFKYSK